ncbi:DNA replication complex GINS protein PSF2 [Auxenochlorella protothecoides]|uniref:DNA replication complex GINS protein PSF2 n=1 Tax=Auxenochlorella protothecoides TaxID=3075 RepID=A0A087SKA8_AUXPR|nr:DNA replication complex GINS protein PSF2 [Auxenochlorella protothecoides]KFM26162.1 DNA replication complex GINS protein PSF2 [Auxenochlorella protothecoides]
MKPLPWMNVDHLEAVLNLDRRDATAFQPLPFHYIEIAHFLFTAGTDEALASGIFGDNLTRIKDLVELVQKARMAKVLAGLSTLQGAMTVKLNNLAAMEINAVRPFFLGALDMFHEYQKDPDADAGHGNRDDQGTWYGEAARRTPKLLELPLPALSLIFDIAIKRHRIEARFLKSPAVRSWEKDPRNTLPLLCKSAPAACLAAGLWHDLSINLSSITAYRRPVFEGMIAARLGTARALDVSPPARVSFGIGTWNAWLLPHLTASAAPALQRLTLYYLRPEDLNIPQLPGSVEALALRFQGSAAADEDMLHQLSRLPHLTSLDIRVTWPALLAAFGPAAVPGSWSLIRKLTLRVGEPAPPGLDAGEALRGLSEACPRLASLALFLPAIQLPASLAGLHELRRLALHSPEALVEGLEALHQSPLLLLSVAGVARPPGLSSSFLRLELPESRLQEVMDQLGSLCSLRCLALRGRIAWDTGLTRTLRPAWPRLAVLQVACHSTVDVRLPAGLRVLRVQDTDGEQMMPGGNFGAKGRLDLCLPTSLQALDLVSSRRGVEWQDKRNPGTLRLLGLARHCRVHPELPAVERVVHSSLDFWEGAALLPGIQLSPDELAVLMDTREDA